MDIEIQRPKVSWRWYYEENQYQEVRIMLYKMYVFMLWTVTKCHLLFVSLHYTYTGHFVSQESFVFLLAYFLTIAWEMNDKANHILPNN